MKFNRNDEGKLFLKCEDGQALIITVLCMTALLGFTALATDVGVMLREKRLVQTAADAAAIAGALEVTYSNTAISSSAQAAATQNGFTNGSSGATVVINNPPSSGPHAGVANFVEALVTQNQPTIFMSLFGFGSMNVSARAVAENGAGPSYSCLYALAPTGTGMSLQGRFNLNAPNCGVVVDSNDPTAALAFTGNAGTLNAGSVGVVGGVSGGPKVGTTPVSGIVPQSDPLSYLIKSIPTPPSVCPAPAGGTLTGTISPGCYGGNVTLNNVLMNSGMYIFTGNVVLTGTVTSGAGGVTLDMDSGSISERTQTSLNLAAPTTGTFNGILFLAPPTNTSTILFDVGMASGTLTGIIYMPGATFSLQDNGGHNKGPGGLVITSDVIVNNVDSGPSPVTILSYSQTHGGPLTRIALVE